MPLHGLVGALRHDSGPPLFYLLEKPFLRIGEAAASDALVRLLPFLAAATVFAAARRLEGSARAWFLALAAASPFLLLYSAEARAYALLALLDFAVFLLLFRGRPTPARLVAGALAAAAALWTHYLAVFFLAVAGALLLATRRWRSAGAVTAAGLLFLPWTPVLLAQPAEATAWIHESTGRSAAMFLAALGGSARVPLPVGVLLPPVLLPAVAVIGGLLLIAIAAGARQDPEVRDGLLLTGGTLVLLLAISPVRPVAVAGRSEMAVLPIWLWAVARAVPAGKRARVAAAAALAAALVTSGITMASPRGEAAPPVIARVLASEALPSDRVVASTAFYLPLRLAKDRGRLRADLRAFPPDLALHPGWFVPGPPPPGAFEALAAELRGIPSHGRAFVVTHPLWAAPELRRTLEAGGTVREIVSRPDGLVLLWRSGRETDRFPSRPASGVAARDREQREPEPRR